MKFSEVVAQTLDWLQREGRISYRALKLEFDLDNDIIEALKDELIDAKRLAIDENGKVLVWTGAAAVQSSTSQAPSSPQLLTPSTQSSSAERRQLTVMFCDLVGSTALSAQLDPEELREVVRSYQHTCGEIITRYDGHIAQYLGDGLLVYFGYPTAHEDDTRRAVRAGLEIIEALRQQGPGNGDWGTPPALQVRLGIHTGLVVIGDMGASGRTEQLALGETPNVAARIQGLAEPNAVLISATTQRLVSSYFECQPFGSHLLKGFTTPIAVYHVQSERHGISPLAGKETFTPLIGRAQEVGLLLDRWEQTKEGRGQVILLSGEPGIGKSRLALTLKDHVINDSSLLYEARCSPYHQHSALYPLLEGMQRTLLFTRQDSDEAKVAKLEKVLMLYDMQGTLPLFTALLSLPTPEQYPPLTITPQKQKERTFQALLQLMAAQAERQATVSVWEDLHWADPSSLEFLSLLIEQIPTTKLLLVLTFRPEFRPPWQPRSHISQLVLNRLGKKHVEAMIEQAAGKNLPADVIEQIRLKTDGVPLFVEEMTKSVIESIGSVGATGRSPLQLAIPATLQEALLARLDRLSTARQVAQLGATLGREFSHELLQAVSPLNEPDLHTALSKLVEAEILYQRGVGEQARYFFKHALIQDTAYHSLLKSTRQQYHQRIARVLEDRFPETEETQPELLAHHYTEANLTEQAIPYWQRAGQMASQRFANAEAITYLTRALELLKTLPDTTARAEQELYIQVALGPVYITTKGYGAPEVGTTYTRAEELVRRLGETPQLFPILWGLALYHHSHAEYQLSREYGEKLFSIAQRMQDPALLVEARYFLSHSYCMTGEFQIAYEHGQQALRVYDPQKQHVHAIRYGQDSIGPCLMASAIARWRLGYSDQALQLVYQAETFAQKAAMPYGIAAAHFTVACIHQHRREARAAQEHAEASLAVADEHGLALAAAYGAIFKGWALAEQGRVREGISLLSESIAACRATGLDTTTSYLLGMLAGACAKGGLVEKGLETVIEALNFVDSHNERSDEAELYRLKGELLLAQVGKR